MDLAKHFSIKKLKQNDGTSFFEIKIDVDQIKNMRRKTDKLQKEEKVKKQTPDKFLLSYTLGKPIKIIGSLWFESISVLAKDDFKAILPSNFSSPDHLVDEMSMIKQAWKQTRLPEWKFDPNIELSTDTKHWINSYFIKKTDEQGFQIMDQKLDKSHIYPVVKLFLKLLSKPCEKDCNETQDEIILSLHHFDYFFNQMIKKNPNDFSEWSKKYLSYQNAYHGLLGKDSENPYFEIWGTKTEKILVEIQDDNHNITEEFFSFIKKTKNFIPIEYSDKQIVWNSKRNVGMRKIGSNSYLYLITTISQLNFWYFCHQNSVFDFMLSNLDKIHFAMKNKLFHF